MNKNSILKIEPNVINCVCDILRNNDIKGNFILLTEENLYSLFGEKVYNQLENIGSTDIMFISDNSFDFAIELSKKIILDNIDNIVGVGGGRVLDVCKYASYISKRTFISIPTTLANDGIASPISVLKMEDGKVKSLGSKMATVILIDTKIISESPIQLIKAGIGDTISNYMALHDWKLAEKRGIEKINDMAYLMSKQSLDSLMKTQYDKICVEFLDVLANSIVLSGLAMNFAGTSRPVSGSEHLFSHALDYYTNNHNLHGLQVALGTIAMLKIIGYDYSDVLRYLKKFDIDINPKSLNINEDDFIKCILNASEMRPNRYTYLNELKTDEKTLKKIYNELVEEL